MTLELYYNTELGAVIDRNEDTRCIAICIAIRVFHIAICFWRIVAPLVGAGSKPTYQEKRSTPILGIDPLYGKVKFVLNTFIRFIWKVLKNDFFI